MSDFAPCVTFTLRKEGGYEDNPADPGGATNMGITIATLSDWRGVACTADDVQALSVEEATAIYGARYWNAVRGDGLPIGVDLMVFDEAVNAGVGRSARMLQTLAHVPVDGSIGPQTLAAVAKLQPASLIQELAAAQRAYYVGLANPAFEAGWLNRVNARLAAAQALARAQVDSATR